MQATLAAILTAAIALAAFLTAARHGAPAVRSPAPQLKALALLVAAAVLIAGLAGGVAVRPVALLLAAALAAALLLKLVVQFPGRIFSRFRLRTRLVTSYVLVAAIPVLLIAALLIIAAYLVMGSYRATLASRLLSLGPATQRALVAALADSSLAAALADARGSASSDAVHEPGELDRIFREHLAGTTSFLMAARRDLPDTTRFILRWAPHDQVPPLLASIREPLPAAPADAIVFAGDQSFTTTAVSRKDADRELFLRAFSPLHVQQAIDLAGPLGAEIEIVTADSMTVENSKGGVSIRIGDEEAGPPRWVLATQARRSGVYAGAQLLRGFQAEVDGHIRPREALLLVKFPASNLIEILRNTGANAFNVAVLLALGIAGGLFLLVEAAALATGGTIARNIHRAVALLHQGTRRLAEDDLDHRIDLDRNDELGELARSFNVMAQGLKERRRLAVEREQMQAELLVARTIQRRLLPARVPDIPGLDVAGTMISSREVGGDSYDFLPWGERLLVSVADVAGKGVPAALLMSNLQAGLRSHVHRPSPLGRVMVELNELILASTDPGRFITLALALIDPSGGSITYANAGHNPPLLLRANGAIETLTEGGIMLGVLPDAPYEEVQVAFDLGDVLVLYTDGVVEAIDRDGAFFGEERLEELLRGASGLEATAIRDLTVRDVELFSGDAGLADDLTVVVVRRTAGTSRPR